MSEDGKINVLIFPCESNSNELHDALSYCYNINLFGASSVSRHGKFIFKNYCCDLPTISDPCFIVAFNKYIDENGIDVIMTTHDTVALFLAEHRAELHAKPVQGDFYTNEICRSKIKTHELFADCNFSPARFSSKTDIVYPVFVKPDIGEGTRGAFKADSIEDISKIQIESYLVCEYLPGKEYSVDCFSDKNGRLSYVSPRVRERIFGGICVAGHTVELTDEIKEIAEKINERLNFVGLWYFQLKESSDGRLKLLEISTRCAGTMCLTRGKGVNLPLLSVYASMGYDVSVYDNNVNIRMDRAFTGCYSIPFDYTDVYIDFDDTITLRGRLNYLAISYLYQCHDKGVRVHLLTRHIDNIYESLKSYAISENLFYEIVQIAPNESKSDLINHKNSIFIDNMFKERTAVHENLGIPVFDSDAFEFLLDWRV